MPLISQHLSFLPRSCTVIAAISTRAIMFTRVNGTVLISTNQRLQFQYPCTRSISNTWGIKTKPHSSLDFSLIKVIKSSKRLFNIWIKSYIGSIMVTDNLMKKNGLQCPFRCRFVRNSLFWFSWLTINCQTLWITLWRVILKMPKFPDVWSLIQQNPLRVYVHVHVFSLLIHIEQLFKQTVIEYSSPHKDLASILLSYHKEKCLILSAIESSSFSRPKFTWSKRSRLSLRSLHTLENFGYYYYNDCVAFKMNSW